MSSCKLFLDTRSVKKNGKSPVKLAIRYNKNSLYLPMGFDLSPDQWDGERVINHPLKGKLNSILTEKRAKTELAIVELEAMGELSTMPPKQLKSVLTGSRYVDESKLLLPAIRRYAACSTPQTGSLYEATARRIEALFEDAESLTFEDITARWLEEFDARMAITAPKQNARSIHLRNLRAVFNRAIDDEDTANYPFRKFKIKHEATRKRAMSVADLRELMTMEVETYAERYRDAFVLSFMLIGINMTDLLNLTEVRDGRVEYKRAKTHRLYSVKVEPEAAALIERWRGKDRLLDFGIAGSPRDFTRHADRALKKLGTTCTGKQGRRVGVPRFPELTTYWARHTWATMAAELDIPKDTIAAALGHGGNTVTDIYIDFNAKKVDEANRLVLDYVLYDKR